MAGISLTRVRACLRLAFGGEVSVARMLNQNGPSVSFGIIDIGTLRASPRVGLAASVLEALFRCTDLHGNNP
jgi:hypothetical protein